VTDVVCACYETFRSVCEGLPVDNEHEGKHYCVLHAPTKDKNLAAFTEAIEKKLKDKDFDFRGIHFADTTFARGADFPDATFEGSVDFSRATFESDAYFSKTTFKGTADFSKVTFKGAVDFSEATFKGKTDFFRATFKGRALSGRYRHPHKHPSALRQL
jgi:uncharacterized protein YjbI with pentapeptide repeats